MARGKRKKIRTLQGKSRQYGPRGGSGGRTRSQKIRDYVDSAQTGEKPKPKRKRKKY